MSKRLILFACIGVLGLSILASVSAVLDYEVMATSLGLNVLPIEHGVFIVESIEATGLIFAISGMTLFLVYNTRQDRETRKMVAEMERLRDETEKLLLLSDSMTWSLPIEKSLLKVVEALKTIAGAQRAYIYLFDIRQEFSHAIAEEEDLQVVSSLPLSLKPVVLKDLAHPDPGVAVLPKVIQDGNLVGIDVPLHAEDEVIGLITFLFDRPITWSAKTLELFSTLGNIVGRNIKTARSSENLRELAVLQERKRLSQDLHDNFSQLTSALSMRAEAARLSSEEGDLEKTRIDLDRIVDIVYEVHKLLREEMIGLRGGINEQSDLMPLIRDCVEHFGQLSNISIILEDQNIPGPIFVPTRVGSQLLRILQESLTNVRRHSQASQVVIRVNQRNHRLCLETEDNGRGFDRSAISPDRLGLNIMQERARDMGGTVDIRSIMDRGTCIAVEVPLIPGQGG